MERLPILPLGQLVVYPHVVLPLSLTDPKAVQLIDEIIQGEKRLILGVVKSMGGMEPPEGAVMNTLPHQLYDVGTLGTIVRMLKLGDGSVRVMVQGLERARLKDVAQGERWLMAGCESLSENLLEDARTEAMKRTVVAQFSRVIDIAPYLGAELHDVGKIGVSESVLHKAGKLSDAEYRHIMEHTVIGADILLLVSGVITTEQALAGFSNPAPITSLPDSARHAPTTRPT